MKTTMIARSIIHGDRHVFQTTATKRTEEPSPVSFSLAHYLEDDLPVPVARIAFNEGKVLPGACGDFSVHKRDCYERGQDQGVNVGGSVVIMPGIVVAVGTDIPVLVAVRGNALHSFPDVVPDEPRLKFQRRQRGNPSGSEPCDDPALDFLFLTGLIHGSLKIRGHVDHPHVRLRAVLFRHRIDSHLELLPPAGICLPVYHPRYGL